MPRLCGHCGYNITALPPNGGRRTCPECGRVGRGMRPTVGPQWPIRRALRPTLRWAGAIVALAAVDWGIERTPSLFMSDAALVVRVLWIVACGVGLLSAFAAGPAWVETWAERTVPEQMRPGRTGGLAAISCVLNLAVIVTAIVLGKGMMSAWDWGR